MTAPAQLLPPLCFRDFTNNGVPLAFGTVATYVAGTTTPQLTYTDSTETSANTNPVVLNARGEANIWLDSSLTYKFVVQDSLGNTIRTVDQVQGTISYTELIALLTQSFLGQILYPRTAAEFVAGVTPTNYQYPACTVLRYGTNTVPGTTDMTSAITTAISVAILNGGDAVYFPCNQNAGSGITGNDYAVAAGPINITGALMFIGETDRMSFKGPRIVRTTSASGTAATGSLFTVTGNQAIAVTFQNIGLAYTGATAIAGAALIYVNPSGPGPNSFYFRNVWFFEPMYYAFNINGVDDVQFLGCTFDVSAQRWGAIGRETSGKATNVRIEACTFYCLETLGMIDIIAVDGFLFQNNAVYADLVNGTTVPFGLNANSSTATSVANLIITGNKFFGIQDTVEISSAVTSCVISDNTVLQLQGTPFVVATGGTAISGATISGNVVNGYSTPGSGVYDFTATPLNNSVISGNSYSDTQIYTVTATNNSPCVFTCTPTTIPGLANTMPIILGGTAVPMGFTAGTLYYAVAVSGATFELSATSGGAAINSSSTGTAVTANPGSTYGINLSGSPNANNVIGANAWSSNAAITDNVALWGANRGFAGPFTFQATFATGVTGTPAATARYTVNGNDVTLQIPATNAGASGTGITITGLPASIQPANTQKFYIIVYNNTANTAGTLSITNSGTITLGNGVTSANFSNTGNQGIDNTTITYQLT